MEITASMVKELREASGAGMMDCKKALVECNGDMEKAMDYLREKGIAKSAKKESRIAAEGLANIYIDGNKAVVIEVNSETDFVSKNEEFTGMIDTIGKAILNSDAKTVEEALELKSDEGTIKDLIIAKTAKIGEKLSLRRIAVIEKKDSENFGSYLHMGGKIASLIVIDGADENIAREVAMHAAAMRPQYLNESEVPEDVIEKEKGFMRQDLINEGKPEDKIENILVGKVRKYFEEVCLENQIYVKAENKETVGKFLDNNKAKLVKMVRYEVGEGMEKRNDNFAEEVMNQVNGN